MTDQIVTTYEPTEKQNQFHRSPAKYRLALGGYGAGKSTLLIWEDILLAHEFPGSTGVIYRKTYPALRDSTLRSYLEEAPDTLIRRFVKTEGRECIEWGNGSTTAFRCLDNYLKLGSMQWDRVGIDEVGEVGEREFRALAFGRLRGKIGPRRLFCASNPVDEEHWLYKFFVDQGGPDTAVFHYSSYDNAAHLPEGYLTRLEQLTAAEQRMYLHGLWGVVADGPAVFPMFNEALHVGDFTPIKGRTIFRGWDPGWHRPACGWWQADAQGSYVKFAELLGNGEDATDFGQKVMVLTRERFPSLPVEDYCDIAGTQRHDTGPAFVEVMRRKFGLTFHTRKLSLGKSIQGLRDLFGGLNSNGVPRARIDRRCPKSIRAYAGGYCFDVKTGEPKKGRGDSKYIYDHLVDADRFALAPALLPMRSRFEGRPLPKSWRVA